MIVLPAYLVIDVSASLHGGPINELNHALTNAFVALAEDPLAADMLEISVIAFSTDAEVVLALCPIREATPPTLTAHGATSYGAALRTLTTAIENDIARLRKDGRRVYRPLTVFITDGQPTDWGWEDALADLNTLRAAPTILAVGIGPADPRHLQLLAGARGTAFLAGASDMVGMQVAIEGAVRALSQSLVASGDGEGGPASRQAPPGWEPLTTPLI